jgi:hypothetical protein
MIYDLWLRWVVTALSVLSAAGWAYLIVARRRGWIFVVSYALDLAMAIAMAVMAWPWSANLPTKGPAVFFVLAAVWFVAITFIRARTVSQRALSAHHALMMLGMAWMYAVPNGHILPGQSAGGQHAEAPSVSMPGMVMSATDMNMTAHSSPGWITAGNWFWLVGFGIAAVVFATIVVAKQRRPTTNRRHGLVYFASHAMMAAGMATMFCSMVFHV